MFNIMMDPLPQEWNGKKIETSFRVGIQVSQCLADEDLTIMERISCALELIFDDENDIPQNHEEKTECIQWYINGWCTDNLKKSKSSIKLMDFDVDQWRIYAAFRSRYGINLNTDNLHFWVFMGLLHNLEECAYTRVIELRQKKIDPKLPAETKKAIREAKQVYSLDRKEEEKSEQDAEAIALFNQLRSRK